MLPLHIPELLLGPDPGIWFSNFREKLDSEIAYILRNTYRENSLYFSPDFH